MPTKREEEVFTKKKKEKKSTIAFASVSVFLSDNLEQDQ